jgi:hypothetical protein
MRVDITATWRQEAARRNGECQVTYVTPPCPYPISSCRRHAPTLLVLADRVGVSEKQGEIIPSTTVWHCQTRVSRLRLFWHWEETVTKSNQTHAISSCPPWMLSCIKNALMMRIQRTSSRSIGLRVYNCFTLPG